MPIRRKIGALTMVTIISTLVFSFSAMIVLSYIAEYAELQRELDTLAEIVAENTTASLLFGDTETSTSILSSLRANPAIIGAAIYSKDGTLFVAYGNMSRAPLAARKAAPPRRGVIASHRPIVVRSEVVGTLYLASDDSSIMSTAKLQATTGLAVCVVALLGAMLMTVGLQRLVTRPFIALAAAAQRVIHEEHYGVRVDIREIGEGDELHHVMQAFNEMLAQIETQDDTLRRHQAELERQVERRTAELREANAGLRAAISATERVSRHNQMILDSAGEGIFGLDNAGTLTFMNPSAARILACSDRELSGLDFHANIHVAGNGEALPSRDDCPICSSSLPLPVRVGREAAFRGCDGRHVPVEYTSSTIITDGVATGVVVTFRDITDRLAVERMKDEFVSTVSHELRTPLTSIRGALSLLGSGLLGSPKGQRMLDIALSNTERLGRLINDILDLEKMGAGRMELKRRVVPARELIRQTVDGITPLADRAGVTITVQVQDSPLYVDSDRIQQMLINLLGNAIKFSPSATGIAVTGAVKQNAYVVTVRDHGRGVPAEKLEMIFQRFKQVDASDSREKGGTGLGLAICRSIAEAHGGKIWAEQAAPSGTVFTFTLPLPYTDLVAPPAETDDSPALWTPPAVRERFDVLLVEDDPDVSRVLIAALDAQGITVMHAGSGSEALAVFQRVVPRLIILDLVLQELDGYAVVEWIRQNTNLTSIPLLVYSAQEVQPAEQSRLTLGRTEFVTKSRVSLDEFQQRVIRLLGAVAKGVTDAA